MKALIMRVRGDWKWLAVFVSAAAMVAAQAGSATFTFDEDPRDTFSSYSTSGGDQEDALWSEEWEWAGTGNPGGFLSITEATGSTQSVVVFPDIDDGELVKAFNLKMDLRVGNGTSDRPADGFSINYSRTGENGDPIFETDDPGQGWPGPFENGTRTGLSVGFDTWDGNTWTDGSNDFEGIVVFVDGERVGADLNTRIETRHGECDDPTSLQTGPQGVVADSEDDDGETPLRGDPATLCWQPFEINLTEDGLLTVVWKNNVVIENLQTGFFPSPGKLVLAGRTGGSNEILHVDNIELNTILAGDEVLLSGLTSTVNGFTVSFREEGSAVLDVETIEITLDGMPVEVEISPEDGVVTVEYTQDEIFASGSTHTVGIMAAGGINKTVDFTVPNYTTIGAEHALADYSSNNRGFLMRVLQADSSTTLENSISVREQHLAGLLNDEEGNPFENVVDTGAPGPTGETAVDGDTWEIEGVINFEQGGGESEPAGVFQDSGDGSATDKFDDWIPGIPGLPDVGDDTNNITAEILTVVEIPESGLYNFAFNSDDGFRTTAGPVGDAQNAIVISEHDGGRGADTTFGTVLFEEPGFYKLRTIWFEGNGGASLEWWTADADDNPIALLNDDENGGLRTFRDIPEDPAAIIATSPASGASVDPGSGASIAVSIRNGSTSYDAGSAMGVLNGEIVDVSESTADDVVTLTADAGELVEGAAYEWEISLTIGGEARSVNGSFRTSILVTTVLANEGLLFIESEDFNYELGMWDQENPIGMTGAYLGGTYQDLGDGLDETEIDSGTSYGVDYFESTNGNQQANYRPGTGVEAGKQGNEEIGVFRGEFDVETNHVVGWNDAGDWFNYTRDFPEPAQNYHIYGHISSGGQPIDTSLLRVTSDPTMPNQETELIGHWKPGRATAGWNSYEIFPLLDDGGNQVVATFGGRTTLRYNVNGGNNDHDYFVFVPTTDPATGTPTDMESDISISWADGMITITYTGTLESADSVSGPFTPVEGASSPYTSTGSSEAKFYLAR